MEKNGFFLRIQRKIENLFPFVKCVFCDGRRRRPSAEPSTCQRLVEAKQTSPASTVKRGRNPVWKMRGQCWRPGKKKKTSMESRQNSNRNSVEHGQVHGRPTGLSSVREARQKRRVGRRRSVCVRCVDLFCRGRRRRRRTLGNRTSTTGV